MGAPKLTTGLDRHAVRGARGGAADGPPREPPELSGVRGGRGRGWLWAVGGGRRPARRGQPRAPQVGGGVSNSPYILDGPSWKMKGRALLGSVPSRPPRVPTTPPVFPQQSCGCPHVPS